MLTHWIPEIISSSIPTKKPADKPTVDDSNKTYIVTTESYDAKAKANGSAPINPDNITTASIDKLVKDALQRKTQSQPRPQKDKSPSSCQLPVSTVPVHTGPVQKGPITPLSNISSIMPSCPVSQNKASSRPTLTPAREIRRQPQPDKPTSSKPTPEPPTAPASGQEKGALRGDTAHDSASRQAHRPALGSNADRDHERDRSSHPKPEFQSQPPSVSRAKMTPARRECENDHTYVFRSAGGGDRGDRPERPPLRASQWLTASRKHPSDIILVADTYRPARDDRMTHYDRDLRDWLTYTNWHDEGYRARFLERKRRLAEIEREKVELLEADQRENTTRPTAEPQEPPFSSGPARPLANRTDLRATGFKRELFRDEEANGPRKVSRIDHRGPGGRLFSNRGSPPPGPRGSRLPEGSWRSGGFESENPNVQPGEQRVPVVIMVMVLTVSTDSCSARNSSQPYHAPAIPRLAVLTASL